MQCNPRRVSRHAKCKERLCTSENLEKKTHLADLDSWGTSTTSPKHYKVLFCQFATKVTEMFVQFLTEKIKLRPCTNGSIPPYGLWNISFRRNILKFQLQSYVPTIIGHPLWTVVIALAPKHNHVSHIWNCLAGYRWNKTLPLSLNHFIIKLFLHIFLQVKSFNWSEH